MGSTSSSSSAGVSSRALATSMDSYSPRVQQLISTMDSLPLISTWRSNEHYGRSIKYLPISTQQDVKQPVTSQCIAAKEDCKYLTS